MEDQSFHEKDGFCDYSNAQRLSESRPKFKPVLVKKLLADESDDDSDDQMLNSNNSDEELDDLDGFQPISDYCTEDVTSKSLMTKSDVKINIAIKNEENSIITDDPEAIKTNSEKIGKKIELTKASDSSIKNKDEQKIILNSYLKDSLKISDYVAKKNEEEKLSVEKPTTGAKRKNSKDPTDQDNVVLQSHWQSKPQVTSLDKRKSLILKEQSELNINPRSCSPEIKRQSYNLIVNQANEIKDKVHFESFSDKRDNQEIHKYSSSNVNKQLINNEVIDEKIPLSSHNQIDSISNTKCTTSHAVSNATIGTMNTPMKHPHATTRPNPCLSQRNIFQTPQNKIVNEYSKNPIQTPATIFSHWSQHHMAQTPMQNSISTAKDSMQTPVSSIAQSQNTRHETPRYFTSETKNVRRPLADSMYSSSIHGPQLPRLQEFPNESQPSPPVSRDSGGIVQENVREIKSVYNSSHVAHEPQENRNPNVHITQSENHNSNQTKVSVSENRSSINSHADINLDYHVYHRNVQSSRTVENYENYQMRESQGMHQSVTNQAEQIPTIQCTISQTDSWNSRQNKIISVKDRQYLVLGVLGQGMSCEVVRAQDLSTSELRAIKCVNLNKMDKDSAQGCLQEICMLDRLKAPCIVHMYNFEIRQPWVHVVMEIGDTDLSRLLKSMLQEKKQIPLTMILYYWTEMLTAVKHIHENGVIHSDLKPANFLLVRGRLKLIDFGIASNINADMTSVVKNCPIGTLNYISPEALMDVNAGSIDSPNHNVKFKISYKSDVWSLGCILYGLVYGVTPFSHIRQQWAKVSAITDPKHKINFPLTTGSESVPLILIDVMRKCLQRDPKARPTVVDLLQIPYLQTNVTPSLVPNIPSNILKKIKYALTEEEWQKFTEILDNKRKS